MSFSLRQAEIEWKKVEGILRQALHLTKRALRIRVGVTVYRRGSDALPADAFGARVDRAFPGILCYSVFLCRKIALA